MLATIDKKSFTIHAQALEKVSGKHLNLDVLKCVRIEARKKYITLQATNLDIGIEATLPASVKKEGVVAVPADILSSFLGNTEGDEITLSTTETTLTIKTLRANTSINTVSHEDFPTLPKAQGKKTTIPSKKFVEGLRSVWYAASHSSMKPELSSVLVSSIGDGMKFVATDSFRLSEKRVSLPHTETTPNILIPLKNAGEIIRNLDRTENDIVLVASDNQLSITFDNTHITSRLIDGVFPDYKQIIPKEHTTEAVLLKQDLAQALKTTSVFANRFNQVRIDAPPSKKLFTATASGGEAGESVVTVDAALSGDDVGASFNQKYITDSFQSLSDDSIILRFFGVGKPMIIRGVNDPSFMYLTMPMNR